MYGLPEGKGEMWTRHDPRMAGKPQKRLLIHAMTAKLVQRY
ncbi:hypothetical protein ALT721_800040 [Alteromonas alvinellae]